MKAQFLGDGRVFRGNDVGARDCGSSRPGWTCEVIDIVNDLGRPALLLDIAAAIGQQVDLAFGVVLAVEEVGERAG